MTVLANARILTMDADLTQIERGWIALNGDTIAQIGDGPPPADLGPAQDMNGDLIMPGMVNPHCHMPMTLFRGLGEDVDDRRLGAGDRLRARRRAGRSQEGDRRGHRLWLRGRPRTRQGRLVTIMH